MIGNSAVSDTVSGTTQSVSWSTQHTLAHSHIACLRYSVCSALQDKIDVNGPDAHPLYKFLKQQQPAARPGSSYARPGTGARIKTAQLDWPLL